jgi:hypothetical protein
MGMDAQPPPLADLISALWREGQRPSNRYHPLPPTTFTQEWELAMYAAEAGVTPQQARRVVEAYLERSG